VIADDDVARAVTAALIEHPGVLAVDLVGSRAAGTEVPLSDWDLVVTVNDRERVVADLADLVSTLEPIAEQWDRLGPEEYSCYMLLLAGPRKIDLIFPGMVHTPAPPWEPGPRTLVAIDHHFWDWTLWLSAKEQAGRLELVGEQLDLMGRHLLRPMADGETHRTIAGAVRGYRTARDTLERRLGVLVPRAAERAVLPVVPGLTDAERRGAGP
jgi:predicted nucleotidyltransferase